jgi:hypothetical protein
MKMVLFSSVWALVIVGIAVVAVAFIVFIGPVLYAVWTNDSLLYELPVNYRGWILIQYGVPQCPVLERRNGTVVHQIPPLGCLCTSTIEPLGPRSRTYVYRNQDGTSKKLSTGSLWFQEPQMIWLGTNPTVTSKSGVLFVQEDFFCWQQRRAPPHAHEK